MKIYDYSKIGNCLICGNIDGKFDKFFKIIICGLRNTESYAPNIRPKELETFKRLSLNEIKKRHLRGIKKMDSGNNFTDSLIIVDGSNCFGEKDSKFYHDKLEMLNNMLADNNAHILFVRGTDDPTYFNDELINLSNIKTIKDYSVIKLNKFNCLCVGGNISIDRCWKLEQEKRTGKTRYWKNENPIYNEEELDAILKEYNIACVVTTSCPSFSFPSMNAFKNSPWASKDKSLMKDARQERVVMDKIYNKFVEHDKKPYIWVYSRFKCANETTINDILFKSLPNFRIFNFNGVAARYFNVDFSSDLKKNEFSTDSLFGKNLRSTAFTYEMPQDLGEPIEDEEELENYEADVSDNYLNFEPIQYRAYDGISVDGSVDMPRDGSVYRIHESPHITVTLDTLYEQLGIVRNSTNTIANGTDE